MYDCYENYVLTYGHFNDNDETTKNMCVLIPLFHM